MDFKLITNKITVMIRFKKCMLQNMNIYLKEKDRMIFELVLVCHSRDAAQ